MSGASVAQTFLGAFQGTVSVLLTLLAGYVVARHRLLSHTTVKHISRLCTTIFLPCLIVVQMGPELTASQLSLDWIIPLWGLIATIIGHLIGWAGQYLLGLPHWTIVACGRPNSNALPILLLESLQSTGVLDSLSADGEDVFATLSRAKSLLLLNAIVQQTVTFQIAPSILALDDGKHAKDNDPANANRLRPGPGRLPSVVQNPERVGLLHAQDGESDGTEDALSGALLPIADTPDLHWPSKISLLEKPLKALWGYMSPPLIGAIIALVLGITPALHRLVLEPDGALYVSLTQSVKNLGDLFVVLQTFCVGAELALVPSTHPGATAMGFVLLVRFLVMPALSLLLVWLSAGRGLYVDDPLVWFLLVLIPAGPSAMLLVSIAELVNVDQGPIAGYLTLSYLLSPLMAVVCSLGLKVVESVQGRG
ncbi:hypothetical protein B0H21DRAFT_692743 [Amylocystis lapponica]|nr:hypothetical protein B0H21DRAFT_692743 [Amylocystis lapponica]